jgi:DNA processing protein
MLDSGPSQPSAFTHAEKLARLRLLRSENVGPVTFRQLLRRFATAEEALAALPALARRGGARRELRVATKPAAEAEWAATEKQGAYFLFLGEADYPGPLAAIEDAPPILIARGHRHLLERPMIGIVGARNASALGRRFAETLGEGLAARGLTVVSGLARGIDTAAHQGALKGGTAAVMAGGIDVIYPPENAPLFEEIASQGIVLTEMPVGTQPKAQHFPRRNRIVSGLSLGVVIVEAAPRSGSLITARLAAEQGREVFAVPGSPLDPRAKGANGLIRNGATLIESVDDVMETLAPLLSQPFAEPAREPGDPIPPRVSEAEFDAARRKIRELLGPVPVEIDELVRRSELTAAIVSTILLEFELAGLLDRQPGGKVAFLGA